MWPASSNTLELPLKILISREQPEHRTSSTKNFENSRTGRTAWSPIARTFMNLALWEDLINKSFKQKYVDSFRHLKPVLTNKEQFSSWNIWIKWFYINLDDLFWSFLWRENTFMILKMIQNVTSREHINMLWSYVMIIGHFFSWRLANIKSSISIGQKTSPSEIIWFAVNLARCHNLHV